MAPRASWMLLGLRLLPILVALAAAATASAGECVSTSTGGASVDPGCLGNKE